MQYSGYSTETVAKITGATKRMTGHWARLGLITPSVQEGRGKGTRRRYSFEDLVAVQAIWDLRNHGCSLQQIRVVVAYLKAKFTELSPSHALAKLNLITDGKKVYICSDERQLTEVVGRQTVWVVPLGKIIHKTRMRVRELSEEWTEYFSVNAKRYNLLISRQPGHEMFVVSCRELPGLLERAGTIREVIKRAEDSIKAVLDYSSARTERRRNGRAS